MITISPMRSDKRGFTLIELLIVIALLGALAVGLLAALDPFEQLKKGTDTGIRNTVSEIHGAVIRYYAIKNNMPWCPTGDDADASCLADPDAEDLDTATMVATITEIVSTGELKTDFETLVDNYSTEIFVTGSQLENAVSVCYEPSSKSFQEDPNTKFCPDGTIVGGADSTCGGTLDECKSASTEEDADSCYWCVK
jgi:prepilin-type N-terminal cleavage/methylation domain-containing protein